MGLVKLEMDVKFLGILFLARLTMVEASDVITCSGGNENTIGKDLYRLG